MKAIPWIVLVLGAGFLLIRQNSAQDLRKTITTLESRVVEAESAARRRGEGPDAGADPRLAAKTERERLAPGEEAGIMSVDDIDLEALAKSIQSQTPGRMPNMKDMVRMQRFLLQAGTEDLTELIGRVETLDAPDEVKAQMVQQFIGTLAQTDAKAALDLAIASPYLDIEKNSWAISNGFRSWMNDEPSAALAWFDSQIAAGAFESKSLDGKSRPRTQLEAAAISNLLRSDPDAARSRLAALPEEHRLPVLQQGNFLRADAEDGQALAGLARETLPEKDRLQAFGSFAHHLVNRGGYGRVTEFMDQAAATPEERRAMAGQAANNAFQTMAHKGNSPGSDEIKSMREFAALHAPDDVDTITGEALAHTARGPEQFATAIQSVRDLHAENPSDDLLVGFLKSSHFMKDKDAARDLAGQIGDPAKREEVLKNLE